MNRDTYIIHRQQSNCTWLYWCFCDFSVKIFNFSYSRNIYILFCITGHI